MIYAGREDTKVINSQKKGTKVKTDISDRKDDRIKAIRNLEKILAEDDENMYCDYCDM